MKQPDVTGELFPDTAAIQHALERQTRAALLRRLGPSPEGATAARSASRASSSDHATAKGIGFAIDLVRAVLDGRKTQTRRPVRPQPDATPSPDACPLARVGDWLYVREPWLTTIDSDGIAHTQYAADEPRPTGRRFRPGMYMARSAARLWLRVEAVRAERLQAIAAADLAAEGLPPGQSLAAVWDGFYTTPGERYGDDPWVWAITFDFGRPPK
ncbi:MAG TPA: hypothetical protein VF595_18080 [Tepidisphaeraceae bacterium]|jgi:hypothetical protein